MKFLKENYENYRDWKSKSSDNKSTSIDGEDDDETSTPEEIIEESFQTIKSALVQEVLDRLLVMQWQKFEFTVVELLSKMQFGEGKKERARVTKSTNDGGIDGIIEMDALGLDRDYVQAKRKAQGNSVDRPDIQKFAGSLEGENASKGVFMTTSYFSQGAKEYVTKVSRRIVLVDGERMARLMVQYGIGVRPVETYVLQKLDEDFFSE